MAPDGRFVWMTRKQRDTIEYGESGLGVVAAWDAAASNPSEADVLRWAALERLANGDDSWSVPMVVTDGSAP